MINIQILQKLFKYIFVVIIVVSCDKNDRFESPIIQEQIPPPSENKKQYLALGDSYTIGQSVISQNSFPYILVNELSKKGIFFESPKVVAQTGWTTTNLTSAINMQSIESNYDLVTLLIGVNNQYQGRSLDNFKTEFIELLKKAIRFANNSPDKVVVLSIPDWSVSPFGQSINSNSNKVATEIDSFNAIKKEETLRLGVKFVNITDLSRSSGGESKYFATDGLHYSGIMHQLWVYEIIKFQY